MTFVTTYGLVLMAFAFLGLIAVLIGTSGANNRPEDYDSSITPDAPHRPFWR